jgi:hypothetical protein
MRRATQLLAPPRLLAQSAKAGRDPSPIHAQVAQGGPAQSAKALFTSFSHGEKVAVDAKHRVMAKPCSRMDAMTAG